MRNKLSAVLIIAGMLCGLCSWPALADETAEVQIAPLSPAFIEWLDAQKSGTDPDKYSTVQDTSHAKGRTPEPLDWSHLAKNPPKLNNAEDKKADSLPVSYDLRDYGYLQEVRNQSPYGSCWTFSVMGALESNYLKQGIDSLDLSELHLAWFTYNDPNSGYSFYTTKTGSNILNSGGSILIQVVHKNNISVLNLADYLLGNLLLVV